MTASLLDCTATTRAIREQLKPQFGDSAARGAPPGLGVPRLGDDPASACYVRNKTRACEELGLHSETARLPSSATTAEVAARIDEYNRDPRLHGILVQLPLPPQVDAQAALALVDPLKDVDGFHAVNVGLL